MKRAFLSFILFLVSWSLSAQIILTADGLAAFGTNAASGGGGSGWSKLLSVAQGSADGNGFATTTPTNTAGCTLFACVETWFGAVRPAVTDSTGANTYKVAVIGDTGDGTPGADSQMAILYATNLTTSANTTWTVAGVGNFPALIVYGFSGGAGGIPDQTNSAFNSGSGSTVQPGSVTPGTANQLIITGVITRLVNPVSVNSGFATPTLINASGGQHEGTGMSFLVQGSAAAINPTWTGSGTDNYAAGIATIK